MSLQHQVSLVFCTHAARYKYTTIFLERFTNRFERFFLRAVDKPTGINDDDAGIFIAW